MAMIFTVDMVASFYAPRLRKSTSSSLRELFTKRKEAPDRHPVPLSNKRKIVDGSDRLQILRRGLAALGIALLLVRDLLTFGQVPHAGALDGGNVHEHIRAAGIRLNETIALGAVEPFDGADWHFSSPSKRGGAASHMRRIRLCVGTATI